jgi:hypothetical protein
MKTSHLHNKKFNEIHIPKPEYVMIYDKLRGRFRSVEKSKVIEYNRKVEKEKRYEFLPLPCYMNMNKDERKDYFGVGK